ncbi:hypothetical protein HDE_03457 [Halotydeus destructor]|nr:hypothetical protein HDE_03457 [Halotydeus destructor]
MLVIAKRSTVLFLLLCVAWKTSAISKIVQDLYASEKQARQLHLCDKLITGVSIGLAVVFDGFACYFIGSAREKEPSKFAMLVGKFQASLPLLFVYIANNVILAGAVYILYAFIQIGLLSYTNECCDKLEDGQLSVGEMLTRFSKVQRIRRLVNSCLGLVPFVLCIQLFALTTLAIANVRVFDEDAGMNSLGHSLRIECIGVIVTFIAINLLADHVTSRSVEFRAKIMSHVAMTSGSHCDQAKVGRDVMLRMTRDTVVPALVWGVTPLGKEFTCSLFGALVPSVVLAVEYLQCLKNCAK